ncbi:hypothetical protein LRS07_10760 [Aquabacterium sp. J223]|nr:hypothetical protein [Aquabacterium sp. J223]UUX97663.1 hypothetical protein LRS07_10760 [Aquabacterium sp. J223]
MAAKADQRVRQADDVAVQARHGGDQAVQVGRQPELVRLVLDGPGHRLRHFAAEHHLVSVAVEDDGEGREPVVLHAVARRDGGPRGMEVRIDHEAAVHHQRRGRLAKPVEAEFELAGIPDVVLVAIGDHLAAAGRERAHEVAQDAEVGPLAFQDDDGERCRPRELADDVQRGVAGPVVRHHQFGGQHRLRGDAVQLRLQMPCTVVGGHRHGATGGSDVGHGRRCRLGPTNSAVAAVRASGFCARLTG